MREWKTFKLKKEWKIINPAPKAVEHEKKMWWRQFALLSVRLFPKEEKIKKPGPLNWQNLLNVFRLITGHARVVDWAPTDIQSGPSNGGVISTPLPTKLLSPASPSRHLDSNLKGVCVLEERMLRCSQTVQARLELQSQFVQRLRDWEPRWANYLLKHYHSSPLVMPAQPAPGECRFKYKKVREFWKKSWGQ